MEERGSRISCYFILILGGLIAREEGGVEVVYEQHLPTAILSEHPASANQQLWKVVIWADNQTLIVSWHKTATIQGMHKTIAYTSKSSDQIVKPPSLFKLGFRFFVSNRGTGFYCNSCNVLNRPLLKQVKFLEKRVFAIQHSTLASLIYIYVLFCQYLPCLFCISW